VIRLALIFAIVISAGCGAVSNFIIGASGNIFSDSVGKVMDKKINPNDCQK
jgi:hypothetical protein